eukprot:TRINITY_DN1782_c1_g1_i2.p1 TRINITY_DN1782_c1_g1~~TRINITY_DN1782_c1_g1_i2.p1  ORF type:complete len:111 (+),score=22.30 TRINITY_DN1782_c1_g1_i2:159-491(+)
MTNKQYKKCTIVVYYADSQWGDKLFFTSNATDKNEWEEVELTTSESRFPWWKGSFTIECSSLREKKKLKCKCYMIKGGVCFSELFQPYHLIYLSIYLLHRHTLHVQHKFT